jgi:hypothetical protein
MFLADLIRHISLPMRLDFIGVSSYGTGTESGDLVFTKELRLDVRGRDVLLIDDILDTGKTLSRVLPKLRALKPRRIKVCVLLDKPERAAWKKSRPITSASACPIFLSSVTGLILRSVTAIFRLSACCIRTFTRKPAKPSAKNKWNCGSSVCSAGSR